MFCSPFCGCPSVYLPSLQAPVWSLNSSIESQPHFVLHFSICVQAFCRVPRIASESSHHTISRFVVTATRAPRSPISYLVFPWWTTSLTLHSHLSFSNTGTIPCKTISRASSHALSGIVTRRQLRANDGAYTLYSNQGEMSNIPLNAPGNTSEFTSVSGLASDGTVLWAGTGAGVRAGRRAGGRSCRLRSRPR